MCLYQHYPMDENFLDNLVEEITNPESIREHGGEGYLESSFERDQYLEGLSKVVFNRDLRVFLDFVKRKKDLFEKRKYENFIRLTVFQMEIVRDTVCRDLTEIAIEKADF